MSRRGFSYFDVDQCSDCDCVVGIVSDASVTEDVVVLVPLPTKATNFGGLFLSSGGLIRCNSIRDTVQAQHKHIPRQRNGHHPDDGEP